MKTLLKIILIPICILCLYLFLLNNIKHTSSSDLNLNEQDSLLNHDSLIKEDYIEIQLNNRNRQRSEVIYDSDTTLYEFLSKALEIDKRKIDFAKSKQSIKNPDNSILICVSYANSYDYLDTLDLTILLYNKANKKILNKKRFTGKFYEDALILDFLGFCNDLPGNENSKFDYLNDSIETFAIYYSYKLPRLAELFTTEIEVYKIENDNISCILKDIYSSTTEYIDHDGSFCVPCISKTFIFDTLNSSNENFKDIKMNILQEKINQKDILDKEGYKDCKVLSRKKSKSQKIFKYTSGEYKTK